MTANYSTSDVSAVKQITDELFFKYTNKPYYLKQTLREIRSLVHQANLKADELINQKRLEDFDIGFCIEILDVEFPNLKWISSQVTYGAVLFTGKIGVLEIRIEYDPSYNKKWDINTIDFGEDIYACMDESSRYDTLHEAIKVVKSYLLPIQSTLQKLSLL